MTRKFPACFRILKLIAVSLAAVVVLPAVLSVPKGSATTTANAAPLPRIRINPIPAFARKYGLPCSACHTAWPELNNFGQVFRDNGYQLMNDRDSPIWQNPSYFPISFRITPNWHRESTNNQPIDSIPGGGPGNETISGRVTQAPSGAPLPMPFAMVTKSGITPQFSKPQNFVPVRPKPVCTSSAMHRPPNLRTMS